MSKLGTVVRKYEELQKEAEILREYLKSATMSVHKAIILKASSTQEFEKLYNEFEIAFGPECLEWELVRKTGEKAQPMFVVAGEYIQSIRYWEVCLKGDKSEAEYLNKADKHRRIVSELSGMYDEYSSAVEALSVLKMPVVFLAIITVVAVYAAFIQPDSVIEIIGKMVRDAMNY